MRARTAMCIAWPAFLAACALELLVFGMVDPQELSGLGGDAGPSRLAVYTLAFLVFWLVSAIAVAMGIGLVQGDGDDARTRR